MAVHCIVPARMGSSRFPGKPLVKIFGKDNIGKPMIVRTLERAQLAECFDRIVCATDSEEIAEVFYEQGCSRNEVAYSEVARLQHEFCLDGNVPFRVLAPFEALSFQAVRA